MKYIYYICTIIASFLASCTDQEMLTVSSQTEGCQFTVVIPEPMAATRALGEPTADIASKPMNVLVFDENGFFVARETATAITYDTESRKGTYAVSLPPSDAPRALHFVLGNVTYETYYPDDSEASIFSQLTVTGGEDVYWQRITVNDILMDDEGQITSEFPELITLVRNFAKISVTTTTETPNTFQLIGYTIVNERTAGTVAPYTGNDEEKGGFATFDLSRAEDEYATVYERFTSLNPGFGGNNAGEIADEIPSADSDYTLPEYAIYVYERNQDNSSRPAYIMLRATFNGETCYYKLDFVYTDTSNWLTTTLNLYRNFHYRIEIGNVTGKGYDTPQEAAEAAASNNIGASVEVSEVNTIRDGMDELYVSTIDTLLVTLNQTAEIYYRFTEDVEDNPDNVQNSRVNVVPIRVDESIIDVDTRTEGVLKITPIQLPETMETYEFAITVDNSGLSRRVIVRVREPYRFEAVDCEDLVPENIGEMVNLMVRLPANMPVSVFPLKLRIEPYRKTIYPDAVQNQLPVKIDEKTFYYEATVTHDIYTQNRIFNYVFKTNITKSQTFVTVTNPYFVNESIGFDYDAYEPSDTDILNLPYNVTKFWNAPRYKFFDVSLTSGSGNWVAQTDADEYTNKGTLTFTDEDFNPKGNQVALKFKLHRTDDGYDLSGGHPDVEIFARYLFDNGGDLSDVETTTGTCKLRGDGQAILYTPNNPLEEQELTFTIHTDYAAETIQLSSFDHENATVNYKNTPLTISVEYEKSRDWYSPLDRESVYVYDTDPNNYTEEIYEFQTNRNGEWVPQDNNSINDLIIGRNPDDKLYFRYNKWSLWSGITIYQTDITIDVLISKRLIKLDEQ